MRQNIKQIDINDLEDLLNPIRESWTPDHVRKAKEAFKFYNKGKTQSFKEIMSSIKDTRRVTY